MKTMQPKGLQKTAPTGRVSSNLKANKTDVKSISTINRDSKLDSLTLKRKRPGNDTYDNKLQFKARRDSSLGSFDCVSDEKIRAVQLQNRVIEQSKILQAHKERLEKQSGNNCKLKALLHDCTKTVEGLEETVEGLDQIIKEWEKHFHQRDEPKRTMAKITGVEHCLNKHDARLQGLEEEQKRYASRLDTLQTEGDAYHSDLSDLKENMEANKVGIEMRNEDMIEVKKDVEVNVRRIELQNETTHALEARLLSYELVLAGIEKEFDSLRREQDEKIAQLARENKRQDQRIEQLDRESKWQDERIRSQERTIAQQGGMIKKQDVKINGHENRMIGQSKCLIEHNSKAKKQDEKMMQQVKEMENQAKQIEEKNRTIEEQAKKLAHFECSNREHLLQQDIAMAKQAKEVGNQAGQIEEQNKAMEEQAMRLEQLDCTSRQRILELQADLEGQTKAAVSEAEIKLEADLESVKKLVTVSENASSIPKTSAAELRTLRFQMELIKARLDRHEVTNRNLISKATTQELSLTAVSEKLKAMGKQLSSIQAAQSEVSSRLDDHITSERLKAEIENLQNHIRECWDRLKERIELHRQGLVSGVNQRVVTIHEHLAVLTSGLNAINGEHERVVGHLANIAAPFRPAPPAQHIQHHMVDRNAISPQPIPVDDGGALVPISHTAPPAPSHPSGLQRSGPQPVRRSSTGDM
ncbi:Cast multi-domain protein [Pyrenophora tritici-repentis]|nr:CCDC158 multi-domain protein [Pyrenophora tritici-repentis]KAI1527094.1 Cast multi-domain protein [Pyrenophora tritici-repentis]KAI1557934.1 Cast multi-domain protein [Pyrenophora tritici-repentis]KAI1587852.1 Cast multi-domain protein [Pyrenophora tritici-repentis]KAI1595929.1 Cast multi-domain protein [Pyrenophora tritici-repentis]